MTIHALFEHQVAQTPDAIAVECDTERLTYRELNHRSNIVAEELRRRGCQVETTVGICVERSIDMLVAVLGILKADGAYVPLDPFFPQERLRYMIADAQISLLVTQEPLLDQSSLADCQPICVDALDYSLCALPERLSRSCAANLAYILYTSGSTGRPKGVQISHSSVVNLLDAMRRAPGFKAEDILPAITTLAFDIAVLELFLPLIVGAKVVIASREVAMDGYQLTKLISDSGATIVQATPATFRMLIEAGWRGDKRLKLLCGGEHFGDDLARSLWARGGELWNMYGPTEATVYSIITRLLPGDAVAIGRPITNTKAYILDENLVPVPFGAIGELYIGGAGLARGYLGLPELTNERFVSNPFEAESGRIYKTGDLARYSGDGRIEFIGRADHQVKIRGFRVELGEIEIALMQTKVIEQAVVVTQDDPSGNKHLVAYVVPQQSHLGNNKPLARSHIANSTGRESDHDASHPPNATSLRKALRRVLPDYMVPAKIVFLDRLPLTPTRKLDRKALPLPDFDMEDSKKTCDAPRGDSEEKLAGIFASILDVRHVGRKDSFFDLGGHSLLATSLFDEIERLFGKRLPLATLHRSSTIEELAITIAEGTNQPAKWPSLVPIRPAGSKALFCIHGAGGNVLLYRDLVRHFGDRYALYGLQSQGLDGKDSPLRTVEAMAQKYLAEIRQLQPDGPYFIAGYCLGGTIAYEIAQCLRRDGHEVALLALLDTYNFARMERPKALSLLRQKLSFHLGNLVHLPWRNWPAYLSKKVRIARDGEFLSLLRWLKRSVSTRAGNRPLRSIGKTVQEANERAADLYRPKPYAGNVVVFRPSTNYDFYPDAQMGWGDYVTGRLDIVELPVNPHAMLIEPHVQLLASLLTEEVSKADAPKQDPKKPLPAFSFCRSFLGMVMFVETELKGLRELIGMASTAF